MSILFDTIEALQQENIQLQAQNEAMKEALMQFKHDYEQGQDMASNYHDVCELLRSDAESYCKSDNIDFDELSMLIREYVNEDDNNLTKDAKKLKRKIIEALKDYHNPSDVEALKKAKEALEIAREELETWHEAYFQDSIGAIQPTSCDGYSTCDEVLPKINETLIDIDKALGRDIK